MINTRPHWWILCLGLVVLGVAFARAGNTPAMPRLPKDFTFPVVQGSPGAVVFSHSTHVNAERPNCTACHSQLFKMLKPGTPADGLAISHEQMQNGKYCGACHNGKLAFDPTDGDKCMVCHRG